MSTNPKSIYNEFIRANLPVGITYDEARAQYVTGNGKRFPTYLQAKWYLDYIIKFGYSPVFSVASLFSGGEAGVWYDPSDLDTLFQDTAGTTPVTTAGQTVGLMLDKSQGLTLGPELAPATDAADWTAFGTNTATDDADGSVLITYGDNQFGATLTLSSLIPTIVDASKVFKITYGAKVNTGSALVRVLNFVGNTTNGPTISSSTYVTHTFIGSWDGGGSIELGFNSLSAGESINIRNISVKELPGYHATQPTAAARPEYLLDGNGLPYLFDDGIDDSINATIPDLGTNANLAYATDAGTTILTGQTIGAGTFDALRGTRTYAVIAINRELTTSETTNVTAYLDAKRGAL